MTVGFVSLDGYILMNTVLKTYDRLLNWLYKLTGSFVSCNGLDCHFCNDGTSKSSTSRQHENNPNIM